MPYPPPLQTLTPCNPPPPPGDRHFHVFLVKHVLCWFVLPICFTHGLALLSHDFKSSTCVCSVIFSLQMCCMGVLCCYFRTKMFSPGDHVRRHSRTLGTHVLATVVGPSPNGTQFCHIRYIRWLPPRQEQRLPSSQEQSQPPNGLVWLCKRALNRLPNQPRAPLPPPHQPVQHTPCLSCTPSLSYMNCPDLVQCVPTPLAN